MSIQALTSRAIIGEFYKQLEINASPAWLPMISMKMESDQASESYNWLGQVPAMREWIGGRLAKGFYSNNYTITNKKYEATLVVELEQWRRDKTGQVMVRIGELAQRANSHPASLLSALIIAGESTTCYDGQYFFDTDHVEGNNTTSQSNDLSIDISALPASVHGSTTVPSVEEMSLVILQCIQAIKGFNDNENEPMNEMANNFLVMAPTPLYGIALSAVTARALGSNATNILPDSGFSISVAANPRLSWTAQIAVFRTDGTVRPFIVQEEVPLTISAIAEGSELEFKEDQHQYGVMSSMNVGYGYWQHACLATMT